MHLRRVDFPAPLGPINAFSEPKFIKPFILLSIGFGFWKIIELPLNLRSIQAIAIFDSIIHLICSELKLLL
jgi:hypothetical protein